MLFKKLTSCPLIVNTSFNVRGEPIVCTPQDAYRCFMRTEMDILVLQNQLLHKYAQPKTEKYETWKQEFELGLIMKNNIPKKKLREFGFLIGFTFPMILPLIGGHSFRTWTIGISIPSLILAITRPSLLPRMDAPLGIF